MHTDGAHSRIDRAGELVAVVGVTIESIYFGESGMLGVAIPDERGAAIEVARLGPATAAASCHSVVMSTRAGEWDRSPMR